MWLGRSVGGACVGCVGNVWECACASASGATKSGSEEVWHASIESWKAFMVLG